MVVDGRAGLEQRARLVDVVAVDELLNLNANAQQVRVDIANAIARAMLEELAST